MNVSSISQNSWWYTQAAKSVTGTSGTSTGTASAAASALANLQGMNAEGDTFQLTGAANADNSAGLYGPPPPRPPASSDSSSSSSSTTTQSVSDMFGKLDTDGDGSVSEAEFSAARPDDVSEEMSAQLYKSLDSDGSGSLSESEYATAMSGMAQFGPPPPPPPQISGDSSDSSTSQVSSITDIFGKLDTDGDGSVSEAEFSAIRPDDVSEEMAAQLYNTLDTDSSGSLSQSELAAALQGKAS